LRSTSAFCRSTPCRSESRIRCGWATGTIRPRPSRLRQRNAIDAVQSTAGEGGGRSGSSRSINPSRRRTSRSTWSAAVCLGAVFRVDLDVVIGEVAGPHRALARAPAELDADADLARPQRTHAVFLAVARGAFTALDHLDLAQPKPDATRVEVGDVGVADRHDQPPQIGIGREEGGL